MVIWLDHSAREGCSLGIAADVLRRDEFMKVMDLQATLVQVKAAAAALLDEARTQADAIVAAAQAHADSLQAEGDAKFESSERLGYSAGLERGIQVMHLAMQNSVCGAQKATHRAQERLAQVVMKAVEQVVLESDRDALLARVGATLARVIDSQSYVTLTVCAEDHARARRMLNRIAEQEGWTGGFDLRIDAAAAPGSCLCEWDSGMLDASLAAQLAALRRALQQTARVPAAAASQDIVPSLPIRGDEREESADASHPAGASS